LGNAVRYDGGHKRCRFLTDTLSRYVEWVPVCPEVEAGLGIPRESMRLETTSDSTRLITIRTRQDHTERVHAVAVRRLGEVTRRQLSGYIFKKDSPSCGVSRVRVHHRGVVRRDGTGVFAAALMSAYPRLPVEEEGRLEDVRLREHFIARVYALARWNSLVDGVVTRRGLVDFHRRHKFLLLAHSPLHAAQAGRLLGTAAQHPAAALAERYEAIFLDGLAVRPTARKHVNVLQHLIGSVRPALSPGEQDDIDTAIEDYRQGVTPLIVPLTLIAHCARRLHIDYLLEQVYLDPYPKHLMLRNAMSAG
jgi:uncharacterized protein YbgA (DUF1722 family)/uncharacterized protein YbbK (DUF523 family)